MLKKKLLDQKHEEKTDIERRALVSTQIRAYNRRVWYCNRHSSLKDPTGLVQDSCRKRPEQAFLHCVGGCDESYAPPVKFLPLREKTSMMRIEQTDLVQRVGDVLFLPSPMT